MYRATESSDEASSATKLERGNVAPQVEHRDWRCFFISQAEFAERTGMSESDIERRVFHGDFFATRVEGVLYIHETALKDHLAARAALLPKPPQLKRSLRGEEPLVNVFWTWGAAAGLAFLLLFQILPDMGVGPSTLKAMIYPYLPAQAFAWWLVLRCSHRVERPTMQKVTWVLLAAWVYHLVVGLGQIGEPLWMLNGRV